MNEFAAMMKYADALTAIATIQMQARCTSRGSRLQPKIHSPMNVDSKKNAISPSNASGAPKMSPTKREYSLQFMPNWNSCTIPVATPMAKLIRNSLPKNRVSRYHACVARDDPCGLHRRDERRKADGERDEDEVVDGGDSELPSRNVQGIHAALPGLDLVYDTL